MIGRGAADMKGGRRGDPGRARALRAQRRSASCACSTTARRGRTARTASTRCSPIRACSAGRPSRSSASRRAATCTPAASASSTPISSSTAARRTARGRGRATAPCCAPCRSSSGRRRSAQRPVEVEGLTFHDTLCITQIHGGVARNVVPDRVEIALNVRFAPGREAAAARAEVEELVAGEGELTWLDESPAAPPRLSEPVLAQFLAETGVRVFPKQAWTDVASLQAHGIPAVNYGPGEAHQAHQPGEWVDGEAIARVASTLARFLQTRADRYRWGHARREMAGARQSLPGRRGAALADHPGACPAALRLRARPRRRRRARGRAGRRRGRRRRAQPRRLDRRDLGQRHPHRRRVRGASGWGGASCACAPGAGTGEARAARRRAHLGAARTGRAGGPAGGPQRAAIPASPTASSRSATRTAC